MNNPFQYGQAVQPVNFIRPDDDVMRRITGRIIDQAQSVAIVSEPRFGKTSLLYYLCSPQIVSAINNLRKDWLYHFRFMDAQMFQKPDVPMERFWQYALKPIDDYAQAFPKHPIGEAMQNCKASNYDTFDIAELLDVMSDSRVRLILLIDEFDDLLDHPAFGSNEFLGSLRGLATHNASLGIVITSRISVSELNAATRRVHTTTGSPYINYFMQVSLGAFSAKQIQNLLDRAGDLFSAADRKFIVSIAGYHPYLLQVAAHALFEGRSGSPKRPRELYAAVWRTLCEQAPITLDDAWNFWSLRTQQVLAIVVLDDVPRLLGKPFDTQALRLALQNCTPELEYLEKFGYIKKVGEDKYTVNSQIIAWWYSRVISKAIQDKDGLGQWLLAEQRDGFLKVKHREQVLRIGMYMMKTIDQNKDVFIKMIIDSLPK